MAEVIPRPHPLLIPAVIPGRVGSRVHMIETGNPLPPPVTATIPPLRGLAVADAIDALAARGFILGMQTDVIDSSVAVGRIVSQIPAAGTVEPIGTSVSVTISVAAPLPKVPYVVGESAAAASIDIAVAGFPIGVIDFDSDPTVDIGVVLRQTVPAGTFQPASTRIGFTINVFLVPFPVDATVIGQYISSPTLMALVRNMAEYIDPRANLSAFYTYVWNVDTAQGFGLDILGRIVGVGRLLKIPNTGKTFGFHNSDVPPDWEPFNQGTFNTGANASQAYLLPDDTYRTLILTKALSNIVATTAPSLNQLLRNLFPGRGRSYVVDLGAMSMRFVFEFPLTPAELAILTQSGALPHPAGVSYSVTVTPPAGLFGFAEQGVGVQPFDQGTFYVSP